MLIDLERRLRLIAVRFAHELIVDANPPVVVNRIEAEIDAGAVEVLLRQLDVRPVDRRFIFLQRQLVWLGDSP